MAPAAPSKPPGISSDLRTYMLIVLFAGLPVYWACLFYIEAATRQEIEELAFAAALCFFGFLYIGMILARAWAVRMEGVSNQSLVILVAMMLALILWLFLHADFQMPGRRATNLLLFWLPFILLSLLTGILVNLGRLSVRTQIQEARVSATQLHGELQLLQSQLSPHFLFNTLNNLYGLSITQQDKVPPLLLKLSELLRYSLYDVKELFVPLKSELAYINNYLAFEQIRIGHRLQLTTGFEKGFSEKTRIAPMLLITFIENAFKHAKNTADETIFVVIELKTWGDRILFSVKNSYVPGTATSVLNKNSGLGLSNAQKRLALLYPGEHELTVDAGEETYTVMLQLKAK